MPRRIASIVGAAPRRFGVAGNRPHPAARSRLRHVYVRHDGSPPYTQESLKYIRIPEIPRPKFALEFSDDFPLLSQAWAARSSRQIHQYLSAQHVRCIYPYQMYYGNGTSVAIAHHGFCHDAAANHEDLFLRVRVSDRSPSGDTDCPPGTQFYVCYANKFRGCCSKDPCALPDCPDNPASGTDSGSTTSAKHPQQTNPSIATIEAGITDISSEARTNGGQVSTAPSILATVSRIPGSSDFSHTTSLARTETVPPVSTAGSDTSSRDNGGRKLSAGAIAGVTIGAMVMLVILGIAMFLWKRDRRLGRSPYSLKNEHCAPNAESFSDQMHQLPLAVTSSCDHAAIGDPFSSFGGRIDQLHTSGPSPGGAIELDSGAVVPTELPTTGIAVREEDEMEAQKPLTVGTVAESISIDPHATLNSTQNEHGQPAHVNYWTSYAASSLDASGASAFLQLVEFDLMDATVCNPQVCDCWRKTIVKVSGPPKMGSQPALQDLPQAADDL
ncbi:hypothetical protein Purlil1_12079 [Purpureocillium lilacinum]|uniref:Uncharacterized protein n=1 Tax=Purpureocillium lilacinum TaxID=33203 RepID=A0ABR0BHV0_PURLI|nr:hypothetical protein Purlil1_12079 [Purpureocillium lilacinum]